MHAPRRDPVLLGLVLLVHLAAFWLLARSRGAAPPAVAEQAERITYLVPVRQRPVAQQRAAAPARRPAPAQQPPTARQKTSQPSAFAVPADAAPAPPGESPAHHLSGAEILEQAKRDMPRIERELRNGVPTKLTLSPDSIRYKLEHGFEDAYVGGDQRVTVDFYTSPDNVIYMRMTQHGKSRCTMNGGPVSLRSAMGGGGGDTKVNCPPASAEWKDVPTLH